ncbi:MAG: 50S ribosomal protein L11 methyltransferase [Kiritimatiellae bacterium]|jgi:ribosomal protein L11 methyltransferase|nr:50S ribosomal protein L11 methyltransferase [Kiritimatiellia bacterium]
MINVLSCAIDSEKVDSLFELIDSDLFTPTSWFDVESGACRVDVFFEDAAEADIIKASLSGAADLIGIFPKFTLSQMAKSDWAESWKRFFHIEHISERVVVCPTWEEYTPQPEECVISLDPGMSFGTGKHATTKGCLMLLDQLAAENADRDFLDMGCGSGILSIGAHMLGFKDVRGFDIDPDCVRIAKENAELNVLDLPFYLSGLEFPHPKATVVTANILATILVQFAPSIAASVADGKDSRLVLSGILDTQYADVKSCFEDLGFVEIRNVLVEEWRSGVFGRES